MCERRMRRDAESGGRNGATTSFCQALMFVVVTVQAQQLPVAAIYRVVVIVVPV